MKENQNRVLCDLNDSENDADLLGSEINGKDGVWNMEEAKCNMFVEDIFSDKENGDVGSVDPLKLFKERNLYTDRNGCENDGTDGKKTRQSVSQCTIPSGEKELCEKNTVYTVQNAMQCELPELVFCYE